MSAHEVGQVAAPLPVHVGCYRCAVLVADHRRRGEVRGCTALHQPIGEFSVLQPPAGERLVEAPDRLKTVPGEGGVAGPDVVPAGHHVLQGAVEETEQLLPLVAPDHRWEGLRVEPVLQAHLVHWPVGELETPARDNAAGAACVQPGVFGKEVRLHHLVGVERHHKASRGESQTGIPCPGPTRSVRSRQKGVPQVESGGELGDHFACAVGGTVVHDDDLVRERRPRVRSVSADPLVEEREKTASQSGAGVERWNDHADADLCGARRPCVCLAVRPVVLGGSHFPVAP